MLGSRPATDLSIPNCCGPRAGESLIPCPTHPRHCFKNSSNLSRRAAITSGAMLPKNWGGTEADAVGVRKQNWGLLRGEVGSIRVLLLVEDHGELAHELPNTQRLSSGTADCCSFDGRGGTDSWGGWFAVCAFEREIVVLRCWTHVVSQGLEIAIPAWHHHGVLVAALHFHVQHVELCNTCASKPHHNQKMPTRFSTIARAMHRREFSAEAFNFFM